MIANRLIRGVLWLIAGITLLLLYGPLLATALFSFVTRKGGAVQWDSFSLEWYAKLIDNTSVVDALTTSLIVGFVTVLISLVFGMVLAFYYNGGGKGRGILQAMIFLPFVMPPIITGLALLIFFREVDLPRSLVTVTIGHVAFVLAVVYRTLLTRLQSLPRSLVEASYDLGAGRLQTFRYILAPNLGTAIVAAAILTFALSFDETLITLFLVGGESTLPIRLWGMMRVGFTPEINALVVLVVLASTGLFLLVARFVRF
jgi:putative spermidine/putrescine transport system permease protein/spermidine/putrescine transport system permease protein